MLKVLDLFSGIGGFSLGLERTGGFETVAFCEINPFARRVLAKHWPGVLCFDDVRSLDQKQIVARVGSVDVVCGGFPCQDISINGRNRGLAGDRSGLWHEMLRIISEIRPAFAIIENVAALCARGLDEVLSGLAAVGYDAEWHCIPASALGFSHERDRVWIVAYPARGGRGEHRNERSADSDQGAGQSAVSGEGVSRRLEPIVGPEIVREWAAANEWRRAQPRVQREADGLRGRMDGDRPIEPWEGNTPRVVAPGFPNRRPRLIAIGNSVVPAIPEMIGRAILARAA